MTWHYVAVYFSQNMVSLQSGCTGQHVCLLHWTEAWILLGNSSKLDSGTMKTMGHKTTRTVFNVIRLRSLKKCFCPQNKQINIRTLYHCTDICLLAFCQIWLYLVKLALLRCTCYLYFLILWTHSRDTAYVCVCVCVCGFLASLGLDHARIQSATGLFEMHVSVCVCVFTKNCCPESQC